MSGEAFDGLTVVAGMTLMEPTVRIADAQAGGTGLRPIGSARRNQMLTLDYRLPRNPAWSLDLAVNRKGERYANLANTVSVPTTTIVDLGARYRFNAGGKRAMVRVQALNLFDTFAWEVRGNDAFVPVPTRHVNLRVTFDF